MLRRHVVARWVLRAYKSSLVNFNGAKFACMVGSQFNLTRETGGGGGGVSK